MSRYFPSDLYLLPVKLLSGDIFRPQVQTLSQVQSSVIFLANHCNGTVHNICVGSVIQTHANTHEPQSEFLDIHLWHWLIRFNELNVLRLRQILQGFWPLTFGFCNVNEIGTCFHLYF